MAPAPRSACCSQRVATDTSYCAAWSNTFCATSPRDRLTSCRRKTHQTSIQKKSSSCTKVAPSSCSKNGCPLATFNLYLQDCPNTKSSPIHRSVLAIATRKGTVIAHPPRESQPTTHPSRDRKST